jgi:hypothetical protein
MYIFAKLVFKALLSGFSGKIEDLSSRSTKG